jgi:hypothetical protein
MTLSSVGVFLIAGTETGSVTGYLYSSTGGSAPVPDARLDVLGTFSHVQLVAAKNSPNPSVLLLIPATSITLAPQTQYWIVLVGSGGQGDRADAEWLATNSNSGVGASSQYHAFWGGNGWLSEANTVYFGTPEMAVQVTSNAPEPCTGGLMALALIGYSVARGGRRRSGSRDGFARLAPLWCTLENFPTQPRASALVGAGWHPAADCESAPRCRISSSTLYECASALAQRDAAIST